MNIRDNNTLYTLVRELCCVLEDLGVTELADSLHQTLSVSSLPGEVLGEIWLALKRIRDHDAYTHRDVRNRVDEGIGYVNRTLGLK